MNKKFMHCFLCALLTVTCLTVCATKNDEKSWFWGKIENSGFLSKESVDRVAGFFSKENAQKLTDWACKHPGLSAILPSTLVTVFSRSKIIKILGIGGAMVGTGIFIANHEWEGTPLEQFFTKTVPKSNTK